MKLIIVHKTIRHEGGKWVLYNHAGTKKLGTYDTEEEAQKRERQIQYFKRNKEPAGEV